MSIFDLGKEQSALPSSRVDCSYCAFNFLHASVGVANGEYDFDIRRTCLAVNTRSLDLGLLRFHLYKGYFCDQPRANNQRFLGRDQPLRLQHSSATCDILKLPRRAPPAFQLQLWLLRPFRLSSRNNQKIELVFYECIKKLKNCAMQNEFVKLRFLFRFQNDLRALPKQEAGRRLARSASAPTRKPTRLATLRRSHCSSPKSGRFGRASKRPAIISTSQMRILILLAPHSGAPDMKVEFRAADAPNIFSGIRWQPVARPSTACAKEYLFR